MKALITLLPLLLPAGAAAGQEIAGDWQGVLVAGPAQPRLVLHVTGDATTGYRATMDSPDQKVTGTSVWRQPGFESPLVLHKGAAGR